MTLHEFTFYSNIFLLVYWHLQNDTKLHEWNEFRRRRCYCRVVTIQLNPIKSPVRFDSHCTLIGGFHHRLLADTSALLQWNWAASHQSSKLRLGRTRRRLGGRHRRRRDDTSPNTPCLALLHTETAAMPPSAFTAIVVIPKGADSPRMTWYFFSYNYMTNNLNVMKIMITIVMKNITCTGKQKQVKRRIHI